MNEQRWVGLGKPNERDVTLVLIEGLLDKADAEIEQGSEICQLARQAARDLLAEVRRLQKLSQQNDQAYSDGIDSGHADIVGIINDPNDPNDILGEIKRFLGEE